MSKSVKFSSKMDEKILVELKNFAAEVKKPLSTVLTEAVENHLRIVRVRPKVMDHLRVIIDENDSALERLSKL